MNTGKSTLKTAFVALFAALTAVGAFIAVPVPGSLVPVVLQNMFALLAGLVLGPVMGFAAVTVYLLIGAVGFPVFAGGKGGIAHFLGPTGGYLIGYALCALVAGLIAGKPRADKKAPVIVIALAAFLGFAAIYIPGILRLKMVIKADWPKAFAAGLIPFIPGDLAKMLVAIVISPRLRAIIADKLDA